MLDHWVLSSNRGHPVAHALAQKPFGLAIRPIGPLRAPLGPDDGPEAGVAAVLELRALLRCISRRIKATYLKSHRRCLAVSEHLISRFQLDLDPCLMLQPALCPQAQAHVTWLAQRVFELDQIELDLRQQCSAVRLDSSDEDFPPIRLPRPHAAAASWISSFEALASAICNGGGAIVRLPSYMPMVSLSRVTWRLSQSHASMECPIHLRDSRIREWAVCDRGMVMRSIVERRRESDSARLQAALRIARRHVSPQNY